MASTDGRAAARVALFAALARAPWSFDFFQALRRIEGVSAGQPRLGKALRPARRAGAPVPGSLDGVRAVDAVGLRGAGQAGSRPGSSSASSACWGRTVRCRCT